MQRDRLYRAGIIVPRIKGTAHGAADQFAPDDLDDFLARLADGAVPIKAASDDQVTIPEAARLAFCVSEDVVRLILGACLSALAHNQKSAEAAKRTTDQKVGQSGS